MPLPGQTALSFSSLETLIDVADAGSIMAAADKRGRDTSTISRHLHGLEEYFGCKLRQHSGKTVGLSSEGQELVGLIRSHLKILEGFRDKVTGSLNSVSIA